MKAAKQADFKREYPLIYKIGAVVVDGQAMPYVPNDSIALAVAALGPDASVVFNKLLGFHTTIDAGLYPWDVERTLERMPRKLLK